MRSKNRDDLRKSILQRDPSHSLQNDALYQFFLSMYNTTKSLPGKYQRRIRNKIYETVSQAEEENDIQASTSTSTFCPSFPERTATSPSSFPKQIPSNIIYQAFSQAGEENNFGKTTPPLSPLYSEETASTSPHTPTFLPIEPQPLIALSVAVDQEAEETLSSSGSFIRL